MFKTSASISCWVYIVQFSSCSFPWPTVYSCGLPWPTVSGCDFGHLLTAPIWIKVYISCTPHCSCGLYASSDSYRKYPRITKFISYSHTVYYDILWMDLQAGDLKVPFSISFQIYLTRFDNKRPREFPESSMLRHVETSSPPMVECRANASQS
jgi:hypothetical protein